MDSYRKFSRSSQKSKIQIPKDEKDPLPTKKNHKSPPTTKDYIRSGIVKLNVMIDKVNQSQSGYKKLQRTLIKIGNKVSKTHPQTMTEIAIAVQDVDQIMNEENEHIQTFQAFLELLKILQENIDLKDEEEEFLKIWKKHKLRKERDEEITDSTPSLPKIRQKKF